MAESEIVDKTRLFRDNPLDSSYGVTVQDFDGDGSPEVFVATQGGPNHLYKRVEGSYVDVAPAGLADEECSAIGVAAADMSGNGLPDIYVLNTGQFMGPLTEPDRLFVNLGDLRFEDVMENHPDRNLGAGRSVAWTDPLGTGWPGLYVCNYGAPNKLFVNGGGLGQFRNMAAVGQGLGVIMGGRTVVSQDFFGKGAMDIFVLNEGGPNLFYRNLGGGRFEEVAAGLGLQDEDSHGRGLQACDFDGDGRAELLWANWEGEHRLMRQGPEGAFHDVASPDWQRPSRARSLVVADLDNDGRLEVFLNNMEEANRLLRWEDGRLVEIDCGPMILVDGAGTGAAVADLDGDGMLEVFVAHGEAMAQRNHVFAFAPNGHHWVRVRPLSPSGGPAIGCRVETQGPLPQTRWIDGGSGYLCQSEPVAHFGLGAATAVPTVRLTWSDGAVVEVDHMPLDAETVVPHPARLEGG